MSIPFIDLEAQHERIKAQIKEAVSSVLEHGKYIMGPEVGQLEEGLVRFTGAKYCLACSSGTDALALVLMAEAVKPGDAVFVPAFTFVATAEVVAWLGATPFFVDVDADSYNIDPHSFKKAIDDARNQGLTPRAVVPVDLFGRPAGYNEILSIAADQDLFVLSDAAQSFGSSYENKRIGRFGHATATSFFPAKPLGCYGDGGAIFTDDEGLAKTIKSLRIHGKGTDKYDNVRIGMNGRLDTIQAAILLEKLKIFEDELEKRQLVAQRYHQGLRDICKTPVLPENMTSAWAQYTIETERRDELQEACGEAGIPTAIYYPKPLHQQTGYSHYPVAKEGLPVSEKLAKRVLSLPMHPYLDSKTQDMIIETIHTHLTRKAA